MRRGYSRFLEPGSACSKLNREVGKTMVAYGNKVQRDEVAQKQMTSESASAPAVADRLSYNAKKGKVVQGSEELLDAIKEGKLNFRDLKKENLSDELQKLTPEELEKHIEAQAKLRGGLQEKIKTLSDKRESFIKAEQKRLPEKEDAFDEKVSETIRQQAIKKGIHY